MVVLLLLSELPVKLVRTDNKEGLTLNVGSCRRETPPTRCLTGRRYPLEIVELSSRCRRRWCVTTLPSRCFRESEPLVPGREAGLDSFDDSNIRVRLGKNRLTSLSVLLRLLLLLLSSRFLVRRLRRRGVWFSSSTSIHSGASDLPLSAELSVLLRLLDARVGLGGAATSSAGRETTSFGGTAAGRLYHHRKANMSERKKWEETEGGRRMRCLLPLPVHGGLGWPR